MTCKGWSDDSSKLAEFISLFVYDLRSCSFGSRTSSVITINSKHDSNILHKSSQCCKVKQFFFFFVSRLSCLLRNPSLGVGVIRSTINETEVKSPLLHTDPFPRHEVSPCSPRLI